MDSYFRPYRDQPTTHITYIFTHGWVVLQKTNFLSNKWIWPIHKKCYLTRDHYRLQLKTKGYYLRVNIQLWHFKLEENANIRQKLLCLELSSPVSNILRTLGTMSINKIENVFFTLHSESNIYICKKQKTKHPYSIYIRKNNYINNKINC